MLSFVDGSEDFFLQNVEFCGRFCGKCFAILPGRQARSMAGGFCEGGPADVVLCDSHPPWFYQPNASSHHNLLFIILNNQPMTKEKYLRQTFGYDYMKVRLAPTLVLQTQCLPPPLLLTITKSSSLSTIILTIIQSLSSSTTSQWADLSKSWNHYHHYICRC